MEKWQKVSLVLCCVGFLNEFRPNEPFLYQFLTGPWHNITIEQAVQDLFPIITYSYVSQLVVVFLITDYFRYKPLIIVSGLTGTLLWSTLTWGRSLQALKFVQVLYGTNNSTEIAYWTYIYAKVDRKHYQKVTSHIRSAALSGRFLASTVSQILVHFQVMDYLELNYLSLSAQIAATVCAFLLPSVPKSIYFHQRPPGTGEELELNPSQKITPSSTWSRASTQLWVHFKSAYTNPTVIRYSIWYSLSMSFHYQITSYVQALWSTIGGPNTELWNGAVEAICTLMGALMALIAGFVPPSWLQVHTILLGLTLIAALESLGLLVATVTSSLMVCYVGYTWYGILHTFAITLVSSEIAKHISDDSFALIFGINTMMGLVLQTLMTVIVVDSVGWLALGIRDQFTVYGFGFLAVGALFVVFLLIELYRNKR
ncbi:thiamine transporter 1-like [Malaya genurostris]|uniref:thiamine transporter 1-like n=1 Tax=Malaya genurostris TaxID=325434 RepID=UPI0026F3D3E1|nr:thiamine transporter 1-like [Malaya genurostris]